MTTTAVRITSRFFLEFLENQGRKFRLEMGINISG